MECTLPIPPQRPRQHLPHLLAQRWRGDDFGFGAVALHVHQQFAGVGVGDAEFQGAVGEEALALFGVPDLAGGLQQEIAAEAVPTGEATLVPGCAGLRDQVRRYALPGCWRGMAGKVTRVLGRGGMRDRALRHAVPGHRQGMAGESAHVPGCAGMRERVLRHAVPGCRRGMAGEAPPAFGCAAMRDRAWRHALPGCRHA